MKVRFALYRCILIILVIGLTNCKQIRKVTDAIVPPTARELYAREFQEGDTTELNRWEKAFRIAQLDSLKIELPYVEVGTYYQNRNEVYSYESYLQEGSILKIVAKTDVLGVKVFLDVLKKELDSSFTTLSSNGFENSFIEVPIESSGWYKIMIQPAIEATGNFRHEVITKPSFGFPVLGKDNTAIQSYWGAARDGGVRSHEGIDIFAERGTPIIAVSEGRVSSTGNRGLGGKQVWLRTGLFGKSVYYAHLDSILTSAGKKVKKGDTLGLVGNTGNARTTKPHLHFGIYKSGKGAINPLPFVQQTQIPELKAVPKITPLIKVSAARANLRDAPSLKGIVIGETILNDTLKLLGYTDDWAHVLKPEGIKAFVHRSLISAP